MFFHDFSIAQGVLAVDAHLAQHDVRVQLASGDVAYLLDPSFTASFTLTAENPLASQQNTNYTSDSSFKVLLVGPGDVDWPKPPK